MRLVKEIEELLKLLEEVKDEFHEWVEDFKNEADEYSVKRAEKLIGEINCFLSYIKY